MIQIINRRLNITLENRTIAIDGDSATDQVEFRIDGLDYSDWDFVLDTRIGNNPVNPIALEKKIDDTGITLIWNILSDQISAGNMAVSIRAFKDSDIWQTSIDSFTIGSALNAASSYPPPVPSEFTQIEQSVTDAKNTAVSSASAAATSAANANTSATSAGNSASAASGSASAASASASAASISAANAKTSETNSKSSETSAAQAYTDFQNGLGASVCPLSGGKIPIQYIPATAITEITKITDESQLTSVIAQKGDLAEITSTINGVETVVKAFQLLGTDFTIRSNWVVYGTSYAVQSGSAASATQADNTTKVAGHTVQLYESTPYSNATKVSGTVYFVFPDGTGV